MTTLLEAGVSRETESLMDGEEPLFDSPNPGTKTGDPDAPYGYTNSGTPRKAPGRKPGQKTSTAKTTTKAIPTPPKKTIPGPPKPKKTQTDYRPALGNLAAQFIGTAAIVGLMRNDMKVLADTAAVANGAPAVINLINTAADKYTFVAAVLDRVLPLAEFAQDGGSIVVMLAQIAVNHQVMPAGLIPGTTTPDNLVSSFITRQMAENEEFAAAVAAVQQMRAGGPAAAGEPS